MNDPNDISLWKIKHEDRIIAQVLTCVPRKKSQKVVHRALNGLVYVQEIGDGTQLLFLSLFFDNQEDLLYLDECNTKGRFLSVRYRGNVYYGIIEDEMPSIETIIPGESYTMDVSFLVTLAVKDVM